MKRWLLLVLCSLYLHPAQALDAVASESSPMGRLFLTQEKRQALERQRQLNLQEASTSLSETVELNGVVRRSSGRNSIWVNQQMQSDTRHGQGGAGQSGAASVELEQSQSVRLRVGESVNRSTKERQDVVAPGAVHVGK